MKTAARLAGVTGRRLGVLIVLGTFATAQQSRWAKDDDPLAKYIIDMERQWAESGCTHDSVASKFLADDFQGTAPSGERYNKAEALKTDHSLNERDCHLDEAKVRFFGDTVAIAYGSERAKTKRDGAEAMRCLVWTDTWLQRSGKWEIIAVQDAEQPCK